MTTTYNLRLSVLRRFVRIVGAAFAAGGVPGAVLAVQSPEIHELGTQLLGAAGVGVAAARAKEQAVGALALTPALQPEELNQLLGRDPDPRRHCPGRP